MNCQLKPFARQTLSAQVYEHLREEIVFMQRKPGRDDL